MTVASKPLPSDIRMALRHAKIGHDAKLRIGFFLDVDAQLLAQPRLTAIGCNHQGTLYGALIGQMQGGGGAVKTSTTIVKQDRHASHADAFMQGLRQGTRFQHVSQAISGFIFSLQAQGHFVRKNLHGINLT